MEDAPCRDTKSFGVISNDVLGFLDVVGGLIKDVLGFLDVCRRPTHSKSPLQN
jgi:hypothetical protein